MAMTDEQRRWLYVLAAAIGGEVGHSLPVFARSGVNRGRGAFLKAQRI
jgi:hypothetical protein